MADTNLFEKIKKANEKMPTITLQGKKYVQVKDRIVAFRSVFPMGKIITHYELTDNYVYFETTISDEDCHILATGHARTMLNKDKAIERCETASVGRALALIGIGTSDSIASYEEMEEWQEGSGIFNDVPTKEQIERFNKLSMQQKANILNVMHTIDVKTIRADMLEELINNAK